MMYKLLASGSTLLGCELKAGVASKLEHRHCLVYVCGLSHTVCVYYLLYLALSLSAV